MEYRIEEKGAFRIVGVSVPLDKDIEKNFAVIPQKRQEVSMDGTLRKLIGMVDTPGVLGVSMCNNAEAWRYYIAAATSRDQDGVDNLIGLSALLKVHIDDILIVNSAA